MAVPHILAESQVKAFKFYEQGSIQEAILVNNQIMRLAGNFALEQKQAAFDLAYDLCQQYSTMITPGAKAYRVWVDVRCTRPFSVGTRLAQTTDEPCLAA
ncbi:MAG: hypothetical protein ACFBSG_04805 [Leptolyngbyaceae cyanobacterium]